MDDQPRQLLPSSPYNGSPGDLSQHQDAPSSPVQPEDNPSYPTPATPPAPTAYPSANPAPLAGSTPYAAGTAYPPQPATTNSQTASPSPLPAQNSDTLPGSIPGGPKRSKSKLPLLASMIVIVLLLVGGLSYALYANHHKTVTTKGVYTGSSNTKNGSANVTAPVTTTVNCGSASCFSQNFASCSPATLTATSPLGSVKYQVYGKKSNGCSMLFEYTANPNAAWVNQPMTCNFDNSKSAENAITAVLNDLFTKKNSYSCTGPLVAILQGQ